MEFICQLRNGYMLAEENNEYKIVRTGYPYPDTRLSSQEMLNELVKKLGIEKTDFEITISLLADRLQPIFDNGIVFNKKAFKKVLEDTVRNERAIKGYIYSVFFSSSLFSIYYFYKSSVAMHYFKDTNIKEHSSTFYKGDALVVLHFHTDKNTLKLPEPFDREKEPIFTTFDSLFEERYSINVEKMESLLDIIEKHRGSLTKSKILDFSSPFEDIKGVYSEVKDDAVVDKLNLKYALGSIFNYIDTALDLTELIKEPSPSHQVLVSVIKEIYGYDLIRGLFNSDFITDIGKLSTLLLSCVAYYAEKDSVTRCILKTRIKSLVNDFIATREINVIKTHFVSVNGDTHVRTFPFVYEVFQNGNYRRIIHNVLQTSLLLGGDETNKCIIEDKEGLCWYDVDISKVLKGVSPYVNKLFQFCLSVDYNEFDMSSLELGHTEYSVRNVMKTMVPNFDRLFLMGAFNGNNTHAVFLELCNVSLFETYDRDKVVRALDDALADDDYFTDVEKSFIMALHLFLRRMDSENDTTWITINLLNDSSSAEEVELFYPRFREGFVEHLEPIVKMLAILYMCKDVYKLSDFMLMHDIDYKFDGSSFIVSSTRRRIQSE